MWQRLLLIAAIALVAVGNAAGSLCDLVYCHVTFLDEFTGNHLVGWIPQNGAELLIHQSDGGRRLPLDKFTHIELRASGGEGMCVQVWRGVGEPDARLRFLLKPWSVEPSSQHGGFCCVGGIGSVASLWSLQANELLRDRILHGAAPSPKMPPPVEVALYSPRDRVKMIRLKLCSTSRDQDALLQVSNVAEPDTHSVFPLSSISAVDDEKQLQVRPFLTLRDGHLADMESTLVLSLKGSGQATWSLYLEFPSMGAAFGWRDAMEMLLELGAEQRRSMVPDAPTSQYAMAQMWDAIDELGSQSQRRRIPRTAPCQTATYQLQQPPDQFAQPPLTTRTSPAMAPCAMPLVPTRRPTPFAELPPVPTPPAVPRVMPPAYNLRRRRRGRLRRWWGRLRGHTESSC